MKSVLISIQPYWVFLIIAKTMGWEIEQEKTFEVRKNFPKEFDWNKKVIIYCSKNKQSFNRIPKIYQPLMEKFLGKVIGEFICDNIIYIPYFPYFEYFCHSVTHEDLSSMCLSIEELDCYLSSNSGYGWHISNLLIYKEFKILSQFSKSCLGFKECYKCNRSINIPLPFSDLSIGCLSIVTSPPQSWFYINDFVLNCNLTLN